MEVKTGTYRHSKSGNKYRVHFVAKHSETLEDLVVYEALYDGEKSRFWVRPASMWCELVTIDGQEVPRFVYIGD